MPGKGFFDGGDIFMLMDNKEIGAKKKKKMPPEIKVLKWCSLV